MEGVMPTWFLIVETKTSSHAIPVGKDEAVAVKTLAEARKNIGMSGTVTIAERLALQAEHIVSMRIEEESGTGGARFN
jgi:hypothetical protein